MFDRLKWEMSACFQNKDEQFSMYISCIKDASGALKLPNSEVIQCGVSEMEEDLDSTRISHSNLFPPPFRPCTFVYKQAMSSENNLRSADTSCVENDGFIHESDHRHPP